MSGSLVMLLILLFLLNGGSPKRKVQEQLILQDQFERLCGQVRLRITGATCLHSLEIIFQRDIALLRGMKRTVSKQTYCRCLSELWATYYNHIVLLNKP
jgi:hypothetical protein